MHKIGLTLTATLAVVGAMIGGRSHAAVIAPIGLGAAADELAAVETVQFTWQGRPFFAGTTPVGADRVGISAAFAGVAAWAGAARWDGAVGAGPELQ
jgi:hypothetical protein